MRKSRSDKPTYVHFLLESNMKVTFLLSVHIRKADDYKGCHKYVCNVVRFVCVRGTKMCVPRVVWEYHTSSICDIFNVFRILWDKYRTYEIGIRKHFYFQCILVGVLFFPMWKCLSLPQNVIFASQNDPFANVGLMNDIEIHKNIFDNFKLNIVFNTFL